jgi:MraZ protein
VFKGTYCYKTDGKGRLPVPAPFRRALGQERRVVVTLLDQCLAAYPVAEWKRLETQLAALPTFSKPAKAVTRLLASRAADCVLDRQGRILLPPSLRKAAALGREVMVVGVLNRFEVWPPEAWEAFLRESETLLDDVSLDLRWPPPPSAPPVPPSGLHRPQAKPNR